jgi:hypothetical protein
VLSRCARDLLLEEGQRRHTKCKSAVRAQLDGDPSCGCPGPAGWMKLVSEGRKVRRCLRGDVRLLRRMSAEDSSRKTVAIEAGYAGSNKRASPAAIARSRQRQPAAANESGFQLKGKASSSDAASAVLALVRQPSAQLGRWAPFAKQPAAREAFAGEPERTKIADNDRDELGCTSFASKGTATPELRPIRCGGKMGNRSTLAGFPAWKPARGSGAWRLAGTCDDHNRHRAVRG